MREIIERMRLAGSTLDREAIFQRLRDHPAWARVAEHWRKSYAAPIPATIDEMTPVGGFWVFTAALHNALDDNFQTPMSTHFRFNDIHWGLDDRFTPPTLRADN